MNASLLAVALALPSSAQPAAAPLTRADLKEVFAVLLAHSRYDAGRREPTRMTFVAPAKERGVLAEAGGSSIEAEPINLLAVCRTRGQAAFILGHELAHLVHRDGDMLDRFTQELADAWFQSAAPRPGSFAETTKPLVEAFEKRAEDRADETSQQWLAETVDPKTGAVFGAASASEALAAVKKWREAKRLPERAASYASLEDRITAAESRSRKLVQPNFDGR